MRLHTLLTLLVTLTLASAGCLGGSDESGTSAEDDAGAANETDGTGGADAGEGDDTAGNAGDAGGNATTGPAPAPEVSLSVQTSGTYPVDPGYEPAALEAPAGATVNLTFTNAEQAPLVDHDWVLEDVDGASTGPVAPGESVTITFTAPLEPGEYAFYCSIGDHRDRGMEGTFTVA